ncbi:MAG: hypothetical protein A2070_03455 [Bdellovibrionales bacterium GWC1_52_8]|nr:MAG: hypothetical protein A2Z97_00270 [Bdellovibrionales bacterium GWB1_52_6]OFZ04181.1 MAG: hypothetical protein A2X97_15415 [Bdellovibrionales bacterium GWA1_52_35]OFZ32348.1 MAG: hypothetical protein A2070_03455 [Bdellovibrionales bacterium GWC1_52_8]
MALKHSWDIRNISQRDNKLAWHNPHFPGFGFKSEPFDPNPYRGYSANPYTIAYPDAGSNLRAAEGVRFTIGLACLVERPLL